MKKQCFFCLFVVTYLALFVYNLSPLTIYLVCCLEFSSCSISCFFFFFLMNIQMISNRNHRLVNEGLYFEGLFWLAEVNSAHVWMDMRGKMKQSHVCVYVYLIKDNTSFCVCVCVFL